MADAKYDNMSNIEIHKAKVEEIQDGERYSMGVKKLTKNKDRLSKIKRLEDNAIKYALDSGVIETRDLIPEQLTPEQEEKKHAEKSLEKATGYRAFTFEDLEKDDVEFINSLEEGEAKYNTIRELFGSRIAKKWINKERVPVVNPTQKLRRTEQAVKFVNLYKENYEKMISGKRYKTPTELKKLAGYSDSVPAHYVQRLPWVSLKINNFHESQKQIQEYHLKKMGDQDIQIESVSKDIVLMHLIELRTNPEKLLKAGIRDQSSMLKTLNELNAHKEENKGPSVAIQVNNDMASVFKSQNNEKQEHLNNSF